MYQDEYKRWAAADLLDFDLNKVGAALDLQAVHTGLADQVDEGRGAQVVGVEDVAAVLVLADLVQLAN